MSNNTDNLFTHLKELGLNSDEARVYVELLKEPGNHLQLSQATGLNRTKIYRIAELLEKRSLISRQSDDRGAFLVAADPSTLQVELLDREKTIKQQREALTQLIPALEQIKEGGTNDFAIHAYEGVDGFKQMLWHELKTVGECLCFGNGELEKLVPDERWTEQQRTRTTEAGYFIREIHNPGTKKDDFTQVSNFDQSYTKRIIAPEILGITQQTIIYNDTVAIYNWRDEHKVGTEIISNSYAAMMRQVFEHYWQLAK